MKLYIDVTMNEWMNEWTNEWINEWMNKKLKRYLNTECYLTAIFNRFWVNDISVSVRDCQGRSQCQKSKLKFHFEIEVVNSSYFEEWTK